MKNAWRSSLLPFLVTQIWLQQFPICALSSDIGYDNPERTCLALKNKTTKRRKSNSWSAMFLRKNPDLKEEMWKRVKAISLKLSLGALQRDLSCTTTPIGRLSQEEMHLLSPRRSSLPSHTLAGGRKTFLLTQQKPSQWQTATLIQWEAITTLNSCSSPMDFHSKLPLPTPPFAL